MTGSADFTGEPPDDGNARPMAHPSPSPAGTPARVIRQLSPLMCGFAIGFFVLGVLDGFKYLRHSPVREAHVAGTAAWPAHIVLAAAACVAFLVAWRRHRRRFGPRSGRPLLLAPLSRSAEARVVGTFRMLNWQAVASKLPILIIVYCLFRAGEQVTAGLDPNFTVNAWGGPTYLGAMACQYLDIALVIAACAWLSNFLLVSLSDAHRPYRLPQDSAPPRKSRPW
jgi:hypothetical protein